MGCFPGHGLSCLRLPWPFVSAGDLLYELWHCFPKFRT